MTYAKFVTKKERKDMNEKLIKEIIMIKHNQATREKRKRAINLVVEKKMFNFVTK